MSRNKKIINVLAGLSEEVTVLSVEEIPLKNGDIEVDITVDHKVHVHPCKCGSTDIICHGNIHRPSWAWHVPQGKRRPCKIIYQRKRFMCNICGSTFQERIPWIYRDSHLTVPLAECIEADLRTIMTKKDIARANRVSVHFVDYMLDELKPPIPSQLPEVICLDETFSQVEETLDEKTEWIKFVTNLSDGQTGELLDILPYRNKKQLIRYFKDNFSCGERSKVRHLCCDGAEYYMDLAAKCFPNATVCLDNFHVTKRLHKGFFTVRVAQQNNLLSRSSAQNDRWHKEYVALKHLSHKFVTSAYNHAYYWGDKYDDYVGQIKHHLSACPELKDAYAMLQYYYEIFHSYGDYEHKIEDLDTWLSVFGKSTSDAIADTVKFVNGHLPYIHNAWKHAYSNAVCEGNNNVIQTIKDMSFGIHNFDYFRTRALLIVGRPGVARAFKKAAEEAVDYVSFFFDDFPSLEEYVLAYDWTNPAKDFSKEGE